MHCYVKWITAAEPLGSLTLNGWTSCTANKGRQFLKDGSKAGGDEGDFGGAGDDFYLVAKGPFRDA